MKKTWKTVSSKRVYRNPYFFIEEHECIRPDGSPGKYFVMRRKPGVVAVPYDGTHLYLVNQYRYACRQRLWEFPAGRAGSDNHLAEAKKELREETGLLAKKWTRLGEFFSSPGYSDHLGKVFLAEELEMKGHKRGAGELDMVVKKFTVGEVEKMIASGEILDSWTITPYWFFKNHLNNNLSS